MERAFTTESTQRDGSVWVMRVRGELDLDTAPRLEAALDEVLASDPATVILELDGVEFLDSTGIRVLVKARNEMDDRAGSLVLDGISGAVQQVLEVAGLLEWLHEHPEAAETE